MPISASAVDPPFIYGPFAQTFEAAKGNTGALSTAGIFYRNVIPPNGKNTKLDAVQSPFPIPVDVRDVERAHILALRSAPTPGKHKRILVAGPPFTWKQAVEHLAVTRPELKNRLPDTSEAEVQTVATVDVSRARELLGLDEYTDWRKTVEDTADSLIALEKRWAAED